MDRWMDGQAFLSFISAVEMYTFGGMERWMANSNKQIWDGQTDKRKEGGVDRWEEV